MQMQPNGHRTPPEHVGILALEVYFPATYVDQEQLERFDEVSEGKYTVGLGQDAMAYCGENEDVVSMAMTAVHSLLEKHVIDPCSIGRLEVGTESSVDRSKSVKSFLMPLFTAAGNHSVEGVDCVSACLGATSAVFNAVNWIESRAWDDRLAIVVASDVALYPAGPARASGGAGAVAMLIGPDAPLVLDRAVSATHFEHAYDFHKPVSQMFPQWDGRGSVDSYLRTLRACYAQYCKKYQQQAAAGGKVGKAARFSLDRVDYAAFHSPFNKMARKAFATLMDSDSRRRAVLRTSIDGTAAPATAAAEALGDITLKGSNSAFYEKVEASTLLPRQLGNTYTASLWCSLASLVDAVGPDLASCHILMFSYGSGAAGSLFSLRGRRMPPGSKFSLDLLSAKLALDFRLARRVKKLPAAFVSAAASAERHWDAADWEPDASRDQPVRPGTYRLTKVDANYSRFYERAP